MSRAFVKETDADAPPEPLAELPVPPLPNPVTPRGLRLIDEALAGVEARLREAAGLEAQELRRQQRYWLARKASAYVQPPPAGLEEIGFGSIVTVEWPGRGVVRLHIVGDDEAAPEAGRISWRAPVAAALIGSSAADEVDVLLGGRDVTLKIIAVLNRPPEAT